MSKKDQAISKIDQTMEISFEITELDDLALGEVIGGLGLLDVNNCTNGSGCTTNDSCGGGGGGGGGGTTNLSCHAY